VRLRLNDVFDPDRDGPLKPSRRDLVAFSAYVVSAVVYITIGVYTTDFLLSFWVALGYLLVTAWLIPAAVRWLR
jgi:hypothetical protein